MKILITGSNGFIGKNLCAHLDAKGIYDLLQYDKPFELSALKQFASECDFVFHLAGVNRPKDDSGFEDNHRFTGELLEMLKNQDKKTPVLISSSVQAQLDNPYGKSKRKAEELVFEYGRDTGAMFMFSGFPMFLANGAHRITTA